MGGVPNAFRKNPTKAVFHMITIEDIAYVRYAVTDLDAAVACPRT
jgi:hypothetical protein